MEDRQRIDQVEIVLVEMLQRQDRMSQDINRINEDLQKIRTSQIQHLQMSVKQSDNIEYLINKQTDNDQKLDNIQQILTVILSKIDK